MVETAVSQKILRNFYYENIIILMLISIEINVMYKIKTQIFIANIKQIWKDRKMTTDNIPVH